MIVFPMAGLSKRFIDAGFDRPKYELMLAGRPVIDWAFLSFKNWIGQEHFTVVFRESSQTQRFIEDRLEACGIPEAHIVPLDHPTRGQAETVRHGILRSSATEDEPITIFNIDTFRPGMPLPAELGLGNYGGYLETFVGEGSHWSFVEPRFDGSNIAARVVEKQRISSFCCTGLYHFGSTMLFLQSLLLEEQHPSTNELYVAPLYQHLIDWGHEIRFSVIDESKVFFCGTPQEYYNLVDREDDLLNAFGY